MHPNDRPHRDRWALRLSRRLLHAIVLHAVVLQAIVLVASWSLLPSTAAAQETAAQAEQPADPAGGSVEDLAPTHTQVDVTPVAHDEEIRARVAGVVVSAACPLAAIHAVELVRRAGHRVLAVSGPITNAPLSVREFQGLCDVPVAVSHGDGGELARVVTDGLAR